jgi:hypothetical protein
MSVSGSEAQIPVDALSGAHKPRLVRNPMELPHQPRVHPSGSTQPTGCDPAHGMPGGPGHAGQAEGRPADPRVPPPDASAAPKRVPPPDASPAAKAVSSGVSMPSPPSPVRAPQPSARKATRALHRPRERTARPLRLPSTASGIIGRRIRASQCLKFSGRYSAP